MSELSPSEVAASVSVSVPTSASTKSAPNETDLRVNPKEADRILKRLDQAITDLAARLTLKQLVYKAAPKIEEMLKLGGTYENVAEVLGAELNIAIRPETVRRHLTAWRAEQRQQQATLSQPVQLVQFVSSIPSDPPPQSAQAVATAAPPVSAPAPQTQNPSSPPPQPTSVSPQPNPTATAAVATPTTPTAPPPSTPSAPASSAPSPAVESSVNQAEQPGFRGADPSQFNLRRRATNATRPPVSTSTSASVPAPVPVPAPIPVSVPVPVAAPAQAQIQ